MIKFLKKPEVILFLVAILTAIFWGIAVNQLTGKVDDDALSYDTLAVNLEKYHIFSLDGQAPTTDRDPGFPLFLAAIYLIFGHSYVAVYAIQTILFGLTSVLIFWLAKKIINDKLAFCAAMLTSLFYAFGQFSIMLLTEILATFVLVLIVFYSLRAAETLKYRYFAVAGFVAGYLALIKSITLFLIVFLIVAFLIINARKLNGDIFKKLLLMTLCWAFIIAPWMARNKIFLHEDVSGGKMAINLWAQARKLYFTGPELAQYSLAYTLGVPLAQYFFPSYQHRWWEHWTSGTMGSGVGRFPPAIMEMLKKEDIQVFSPAANKFLGSQYGGYYMDAYNEALRNNWPKAIYFAGFEAVKLNVFLSPFSVDFGIDGMFSDTPLTAAKVVIILVLRILWVLFFGLAVYGIIKSLRHWRNIIFLFVPILYFNGIYIFFDAIPRYALPIYPYYFIFFVIGSVAVIRRLKNEPADLFFKPIL